MSAVVSVIVVGLVGLGAVVASEILNKKKIEKTQRAKSHIRRALIGSENLPNVDKYLLENFSNHDIPRVKSLLLDFAKLLDVPAATLLSNAPLVDVLSVNDDEMGGGEGGRIEPFSREIFDFLEGCIDRGEWKKEMQKMHGKYSSEDEFLDYIMKMDMTDFLTYFSPFVANELASED